MIFRAIAKNKRVILAALRFLAVFILTRSKKLIRFLLRKNVHIAVSAGSLAILFALSLYYWNVLGFKSFIKYVSPGKYSIIRLDLNNSLEVGLGLLSFKKDKDIIYTVKKDESLSEIAYIFNMNEWELAVYNKLTRNNSIPEGGKIIIPSRQNLRESLEHLEDNSFISFETNQEYPADNWNNLPENLKISVKTRYDGKFITAECSVETAVNPDEYYFQWNLGNGYLSFKSKTFWTYKKAGRYGISLMLRNKWGYSLRSNTVYVDVPKQVADSESAEKFITLNNVGDVFLVSGKIIQVEGYSRYSKLPVDEVNSSQGKTTYRALEPGYFHIVSQDQDKRYEIYLFVSPILSKHLDRTDTNWYRTQFNTGTTSNCGPSVASMAIGWANAEYVNVREIRDKLGWKNENGGTSFFELKKILEEHGVTATITNISTPEDIFEMIDRGNVVAVLYDMSEVSSPANPERNLFGQYYQDKGGHYLILKGYSLNKKYFIVYDPIPSDWVSNSKRYPDGISMLGRNRYYPVDQLFSALRTYSALEVSR